MRRAAAALCACALPPTAAAAGAAVSVASAAIVPVKWDKEANWRRIEAAAEAAAAAGAELVVTPEGALEGYVINEVNDARHNRTAHEALVRRFVGIAEPLDGVYAARASALARRLGVHLLLGFLQRNESAGLVHNAAALYDDGGRRVLLYHKTHFAQGYEVNPACYAPGGAFPVARTRLGAIGVMICFDRQLPEVARSLRAGGAGLILTPSYGSYTAANTSRDGWNTRLLQTRAYENGVPLVFCNPGQTLFIDRHGELTAVGGGNTTTFGSVVPEGPPIYPLQHRRPPLYSALSDGADPADTQHAYSCAPPS